MYYSLAKQGGRLADIKSFCCSATLMCPMTTPLVHLCAGSSPRPLLGEWRSCESEPCFPRTTIQNALDPSPFPWRAKHVHSEVRGGIPEWITKLWKALPLEDCLTELLAPFPLPSTATQSVGCQICPPSDQALKLSLWPSAIQRKPSLQRMNPLVYIQYML